MRKNRWVVVPLMILIIYLIGPRPSKPIFSNDLPVVPASPSALDNYIAEKEKQHKLRKDNEARIVWADSSHTPTEYVILYLHGFSASQGEGDPVHRQIAARFHSNLLLTRLSEHGIDTTEKMVNMTADGLWNSAKESFALAGKLGKKVILMGTSTGGTLALMLAARYPNIAGVVLLSPNIEIFSKSARILNDPWGLNLAQMIKGSDYIYSEDTSALYKQYWSYGYRIEAAVQLEEMLETTMVPETFRKVTQPLLLLYYYKDPVHQDSVVSVAAMQKMYSELGTPPALKREKAIPNAGNHVIGSYIRSRDVEGVKAEIEKFLHEVMKLK